MCSVCGCGETQHHHHNEGPARAHAPGLSQSRMVQIEQDILSRNDQYAHANRCRLQEQHILALNLVSSPGSGKTTLLTRTIADLRDSSHIYVIEGDQQTSLDADRIKAAGALAIQINTGKGCHLDAHRVGHAIDELQVQPDSLLFIENVGNLVCPAAFDLGESARVAILSVTEGEDKPIKYPDLFHSADLILLNKIDLLPYVSFDTKRCIDFARQVNASAEFIQLSCTTGEGLEQWYHWINQRRQPTKTDS